ncbi:MAG: HAD family phosphatase [Nitrososphaerota archaeon]|jgi:HAD superfamily hydrolase (TIGR01509 family)|nr:HAD family phosphatase [Nitrososphaerota archaeon]
MVKAVIFDWDGTLADTRATIVTSFHQALKEINIHISDEYIERRMGIGAAETFREILQETKQPVNEELVKWLVECKSQSQIRLKSQVQLFQGAIELLEMLQGKVKVGLASMNSKVVIDALINAKGVEAYFQAVITADEVKYFKPHPEIFLKCAQQLDTSPLECIIVEDSLFGIKAAKAAGMGCIAVTTGAYSKEELEQEKPEAIVASLEQAKVLLQNKHFYK